MYFKRPSFKRGGPTGIDQLTPRAQARGGGNIGGGGIGGRNLGTRTGFNVILNEFGMPYEKPPSTYKPNFNLSGNSYIPRNYPLTVIPNVPSGLSRLLAKYPKSVYGGGLTAGAGVGTGIGLLADAYQKATKTPLAYKKLKEVSKRPYYFDETNIDVGEGLDEIRTANEIGEAPGFFPRGGKNKFYEDRGLDPKTGLPIERDTEEVTQEDGITNYEYSPAETKEQMNAAENLMREVEEKKKIIEPGSDESSITLDPYAEIKEEKDFLSKMLKNEGLARGEIALIAAKAIGTEGSLKDKLDAAIDLALPVVRRRDKEDKALTLTAYRSFKEKQKAQAKAGQDTTGIKDLKYQANILRKSGDPQYKDKSQEEIISIIIKDKFGDADSITRKKNLSDRNIQGEIYERFESLKDKKTQLDLYIEEKYTKKNKTIDTADKKLLRYQKALEQAKEDFNLFTSIPEFGDVHGNLLEAYGRLGVKDGGRIKRALGTPPTGEQIITTEAQTIGAETAEKPVMKLDYAQLRDRLPQEITDDVVQLLANSEEALQEFAYIQTQNDVDAFNLKYGVNLIIPPAPQTA